MTMHVGQSTLETVVVVAQASLQASHHEGRSRGDDHHRYPPESQDTTEEALHYPITSAVRET